MKLTRWDYLKIAFWFHYDRTVRRFWRWAFTKEAK